MADAYTVESALKELRETFPYCVVRAEVSEYAIRNPFYNIYNHEKTVTVCVAQVYHFTGKSIDDVMAQVKKWRESSPESK